MTITAEKLQVKPKIRWMIRRDMPTVLQIEKSSFVYNTWSEEDFLNVLRQRNCIGMVAELKEDVVGFMVYELEKSYLEVINLAVAADLRRNGIATQMTKLLKEKLSPARRTSIRMKVMEDNLNMQLFLRSQCFKAINVEKNYYKLGKKTRDAYCFQYSLYDAMSNFLERDLEDEQSL